MDQMVTGDSPVSMSSGGRRWRSVEARHRGKRRGRRGRDGPVAHQRAKAVDGEVRGGRMAARRCSDAGGRGGEEADDDGDCGPPSTGWLHREEEEDEAVTTG